MAYVQLSRDEIFNIFQEVVFDRGSDVTLREFLEETGVAESQIRKHFGSWTGLRREQGCGGEVRDLKRHSDEELWDAYHTLVDRLGRFPTNTEVNRLSPFSIATYYSRFGTQPQVKAGYRKWLKRQETTPDATSQRQHPGRFDRPDCVSPEPMPPEPRDKLIWLQNRCREIRITYELRSSEFKGRSSHQWDVLVVLEHDWPACPIKVLRLCDLLPRTRSVDPDSPPPLDDEPTRAELYGRMPWEEELLRELPP